MREREREGGGRRFTGIETQLGPSSNIFGVFSRGGVQEILECSQFLFKALGDLRTTWSEM